MLKTTDILSWGLRDSLFQRDIHTAVGKRDMFILSQAGSHGLLLEAHSAFPAKKLSFFLTG